MAKRNLDQFIKIRVSEYEKNRIRYLANNFAGGNMSLWIVYCALNMPRKNIKSKEIEETTRKKKGLKSVRP